MIFLFIILNILIYSLVGSFIFIKIRNERRKIIEAQENNLSIAMEELEKKEAQLTQLLEVSLGLIRNEDILALDAMLDDLQASINAEKGRFAITETEVDNIEIRLRELGELKRELEVSNMDAVREVDMLKSQERDLASQNETLLDKLTEATDQVDILFDMFSSQPVVQENLNLIKENVSDIKEKLSFYETEISEINQQYIVLKKAYDALDIEYAQLYEKRQQDQDSSGRSSTADEEDE